MKDVAPAPIDSRTSLTLGEAARVFFRRRNAWIIAVPLATAAVARVVVGRFTWRDALVAGVMIALQPLVEWVIHVFVLHFRPKEVAGRRLDLAVARKHRAHHRDPRDLELVFVPLPDLVGILAALAVGFLVIDPHKASGLTGVLTGYALLGLYEWTHFLIHQPYTPRSRWYRYVRRAHWLHHYKNENYWFGVTIHLADHLLRTFPARDAVPTSPTARNLGVEEETTAAA